MSCGIDGMLLRRCQIIEAPSWKRAVASAEEAVRTLERVMTDTIQCRQVHPFVLLLL
jgi:hypothetical protein